MEFEIVQNDRFNMIIRVYQNQSFIGTIQAPTCDDYIYANLIFETQGIWITKSQQIKISKKDHEDPVAKTKEIFRDYFEPSKYTQLSLFELEV